GVPGDVAHRGQHAFVEGRLPQLLARKVDLDSDDLDHVPPQDCEMRFAHRLHGNALHSCWSWFARPAARDVLTQETECSPQLARLTAGRICVRGDYVRRPDLAVIPHEGHWFHSVIYKPFTLSTEGGFYQRHRQGKCEIMRLTAVAVKVNQDRI